MTGSATFSIYSAKHIVNLFTLCELCELFCESRIHFKKMIDISFWLSGSKLFCIFSLFLKSHSLHHSFNLDKTKKTKYEVQSSRFYEALGATLFLEQGIWKKSKFEVPRRTRT